MNGKRCALLFCLMTLAAPVAAQSPQWVALFPAGAQAGQTIEAVALGANLTGARQALVHGAPGVSVEVLPGGAPADESQRPLVQARCTGCHELRTPENRTLTPGQWEATVERMVRVRGAPIAPEEQARIASYLQARARAGVLSLRVQVAPDATPGVRELRLLTAQGVSTAYPFEVGTLPETLISAPSVSPDLVPRVKLPVVVNGALARSAERHEVSFDARKDERFVFDLRAFRLCEASAAFFNPTLAVLDAKGKELARNRGAADLDPVLFWTAPADGAYRVQVRDLLWKGNPASVYRLRIAADVPPAPLPAAFEAPDFALEALPDTINLGPGSAAAVLVRATRREGVVGPIVLNAADLPPGVSAEPAAIAPDDDKTVLILRAAPGAAPAARTFAVVGAARAGNRNVVRAATPIELYRGPANGLKPYPRQAMAVGILPASAPFALRCDVDTVGVKPGEKTAVTVQVLRQGGFTGGVVVFVQGLPGYAYPNPGAVYVPPEKSEAIFEIVGYGHAGRLATREKGWPPLRFAFVGLVAGVNEQPYGGAAALTLTAR